MNLVVSILPHY